MATVTTLLILLTRCYRRLAIKSNYEGEFSIFERNYEAILPTLRRTNSREIDCIDTRIVGVDAVEHIVHMGEYNDILGVIRELVNSNDYERLDGYKCEY